MSSFDKSQTRKKRKTKATARKMTMTKTTMATRSEHDKPTITFTTLVDKLQQHYGPPAPPPSTDPLELIIWDNIAYLASDKRRAEAFAALEQSIGTRTRTDSCCSALRFGRYRQSWHTPGHKCGKTSHHRENRV